MELPHGSVFIVAVGIMVALTGLVLLFSRQVRVEALASGNLLADAQADAIVKGAAAYVLNRLVANTDRTTLDSEIQSEAVPLGDGYFWLLRPYPDDETQYGFGVQDESGKLNINMLSNPPNSGQVAGMLAMLPGMTTDLAGAIEDWCDADDVENDFGGAENSYYLSLPEPYYCKDAPFETLDELLLVKGGTPDVLYGIDANRNGVVDANEAGTSTPLAGLNGQARCGVCKYLTLYSHEPNTAPRGQPAMAVGRINVNTAPREVLACLPGLDDGDVEMLITARTGSGPNLNDISWVQSVGIAPDKLTAIRGMITVNSYQFTADIVGVSSGARSFKRVRYVFDLTASPPTLLSCKDMTPFGWPLSDDVRTALRNGQPPPITGNSAGASSSLGLKP